MHDDEKKMSYIYHDELLNYTYTKQRMSSTVLSLAVAQC